MKKIYLSILKGLAMMIGIGITLWCLAIAGTLVGCAYFSFISEHSANLEKVNIGDTDETVINKMNPPYFVETKDTPEGSVPMGKCEDKCVKRFWYSDTPCTIIDFWVVEFDIDNKVLSKYKLSSP